MTRKRMLRTLWIGLLVAALAGLAAPSLASAEDVTEETKAQKGRGAGEDENIKERSPKNDPKAKAEAPAEKGGDKTRGVCRLVIDNWTSWKIQIFVDGVYVGLVNSWGNASGYYGSGRHVLYGLAEFWDAPDMTWGPKSVSCFGTYTWKLID